LAAGFVIVKVRFEVPFTAMVVGLNAFWMVGGPSTCRFAVLLVAPVPPFADETAPVVLLNDPTAVPVTFTENVQFAFAASVALLRLMLFVPAPAVMVPPPQLPESPFGVNTRRPAGRPSENPVPL